MSELLCVLGRHLVDCVFQYFGYMSLFIDKQSNNYLHLITSRFLCVENWHYFEDGDNLFFHFLWNRASQKASKIMNKAWWKLEWWMEAGTCDGIWLPVRDVPWGRCRTLGSASFNGGLFRHHSFIPQIIITPSTYLTQILICE